MARPAATQMIDTSSLTTDSTAAVTAARTGLMVENVRIQRGDSAWRWRVTHRYTPNAMSNDPSTTRIQDAHVGGVLCRPPSRPEAATKIAVSAHSPNTQPPRKAKAVGRGRGACKT